jgi:hypothetical protein
MAAVGGAGVETDADFKQTVLLLHGDGTNGAQNNTFLDGSTNNFTITRNGNTTQGTFSPFSVGAGEWSNYFDGSGDRLQIASNAAFEMGTGDFTIEGWMYPVSFGSSPSNRFVLYGHWSGGGTARFVVCLTSTGVLVDSTAGLALTFSGSTTITANAWYHVAVVRNGNSFKTYINGTEISSATSSSTYTPTGVPVNIGDYIDDYATGFGYISNLRVVKGTAVYTANFTPSTTPLTAITNTSLLTCQSNRFVDNSTNAFAITRNGDVKVTPFSPFAPTAAYSASTNGGSGYFDGSGDYLSVPDNAALQFGTGDFTISFWFYGIGTQTGGAGIIQKRPFSATTGDWSIAFDTTTPTTLMWRQFGPTVQKVIATNVSANEWHHVVVVSDSGTIKTYFNSVAGETYVNSDSLNGGANALVIGTPNPTAPVPYYFKGYVSSIYINKGTALIPSSNPTSPNTNISGTSLLLNFTNAGILDSTAKNNLETVGNAQIDTTTKKFGTGSMEFDGTGDWLLMANTPDQQLGTGNFTIEFWVYLATGDIGSARGLVAKGTSTTGWLVSLDSSEKVVFTYSSSTITSSGAITTNAWNHIAVVREGTGSNQTKIYIGGTNDGTGTVSTDFNQTSVMYVGCNRTAGDPMKGFIDDLRITKGVARYTSNFTAPTKAFADQ